jgi:hypothetical protein
MTKDNDTQELFNEGKARWLKEHGDDDLDRDQRALLLALTELEAELGRDLTEEERSAVDALSEQLEGFDAEAIKTAVHKMVTQPADPERKVSWPELKKRRS